MGGQRRDWPRGVGTSPPSTSTCDRHVSLYEGQIAFRGANCDVSRGVDSRMATAAMGATHPWMATAGTEIGCSAPRAGGDPELTDI